MTSRERISRMFNHQEADRVPINDGPWSSTFERWVSEGYPRGVPLHEYFDYDHVESISIDTSPRYPTSVVEETDDYIITKTSYGATIKNWKKHGGVPEFLDFTIVDPESWAEARKRMAPTEDRLPWKALQSNYQQWRDQGAWISAQFWFGFDVTHSWAVGTDRVLIALIEDPDWVSDMFNHYLDMDLELFSKVWDAGYHFDEIHWPDDMGYRQHQFFSVDTYREVLKPVHKRACDWAHERGVSVRMHSCGDIRPFVPELIEIGVDMLNPLEVKAGMNPPELKQKYGDQLAFHGGLNAALFPEPERLYAQMEEFVPVMKQGGGYWLSSDHSVPDSVSLDDFTKFVALGKKLGSYQ